MEEHALVADNTLYFRGWKSIPCVFPILQVSIIYLYELLYPRWYVLFCIVLCSCLQKAWFYSVSINANLLYNLRLKM